MSTTTLKIGKMKWIYLSRPDRRQLEDMVKGLDLHEMVEQDILEPSAHDKIDIYDDCIFLVMHFPKYNEKLEKMKQKGGNWGVKNCDSAI